MLRSKMRELDTEKQYVVYCDSGGRSSAGAFLLAQRGFDACYLAGGLMHSPIGASAKAPTTAPARVRNRPAPSTQSPSLPPKIACP